MSDNFEATEEIKCKDEIGKNVIVLKGREPIELRSDTLDGDEHTSRRMVPRYKLKDGTNVYRSTSDTFLTDDGITLTPIK